MIVLMKDVDYFPCYHYHEGVCNLSSIPFNRAPVAITIKNRKELQTLQQHFEQENLNTRFPYPIYIIYDNKITPKQINVIKNKSELPPYFNIKLKNLSKIEYELLRKINILAESIRNIPIAHNLDIFSSRRHLIKKLFMISRETQYYENIIKLNNSKR